MLTTRELGLVTLGGATSGMLEAPELPSDLLLHRLTEPSSCIIAKAYSLDMMLTTRELEFITLDSDKPHMLTEPSS